MTQRTCKKRTKKFSTKENLIPKKVNIFLEQQEQEAISRIQRFAKLARAMQFEVCVGFSGGKDSQVVYDLCKRSGIDFKAYFNHAFESATTLRFIRDHYPEVTWRRDYPYGFISNIRKQAMLPTVQRSFCCENYKHNPDYVDPCSVIGVRSEESYARRNRTTVMVKNKTTLKKNKALLDDYFRENCQSIGTKSVIQLLPIIDWSHEDVWQYIREHGLPVNPEYSEHVTRVGCIVCPKANFNANYYGLSRYPLLVDAFIRALEHPYSTPPDNGTGLSRATGWTTPTTRYITSAAGSTTASCHSPSDSRRSTRNSVQSTMH